MYKIQTTFFFIWVGSVEGFVPPEKFRTMEEAEKWLQHYLNEEKIYNSSRGDYRIVEIKSMVKLRVKKTILQALFLTLVGLLILFPDIRFFVSGNFLFLIVLCLFFLKTYIQIFSDLLETEDIENKIFEDFHRALGHDPSSVKKYYNRGLNKCKLGYYKGACKDLDEALKLDSSFKFTYSLRGMAKIKLGNTIDGFNDLDKALELDPNFKCGYNFKGIAKNELGDYLEAIKDFDKALELDPNFKEACYNRGLAKRELGDDEGALKDFKMATELKNQK